MKNAILLITGIVLTILFLIFATPAYELLYYESSFSNEMFNNNMYFIIAIVTVILCWAMAGIYYYLIDSVRFSRWYHWGIILIAAMLLSALFTYFYPNNEFLDQELDLSSDLVNFSIVNVLVSGIVFIIASFSIRWWSSNCRHTPIPE